MRKPLSRPERDDCGTSQTSIRRHPQRQSARRGYAVAPLPYRGVALRHVGPRDAAWAPLSISTWVTSSPLGLCASGRGARGNTQRYRNTVTHLYDQICGRNRERLAGGGHERPARRHDGGEIPRGCPLGDSPDLVRHQGITSSLGLRGPVRTRPVGMGPRLD
jgi:hypothetical protein